MADTIVDTTAAAEVTAKVGFIQPLFLFFFSAQGDVFKILW